MLLYEHTTIATILKTQPDSLEVMISLHPGFARLRNPLLRKLMAGRTTLAMAAKMGGIQLTDFYTALLPLGFTIGKESSALAEVQQPKPAFMMGIEPGNVIELDVRPMIGTGKDPLQIIMKKIGAILPGQTLKIINSFEPAPLVLLLEKKGFITYIDRVKRQLVETYFFKPTDTQTPDQVISGDVSTGWDEVLLRFKHQLVNIDVRHLAMPQPMLTILDALESLPAEKALLVSHKRIPVFLLPELADRNFEYRIQESPDGLVKMIIFKD